MGLIVDRHELIDADLGVFLGGGEGDMAEEFLDGAQVGAAVEKVGGEGMAQGMGRGLLENPGLDELLFEVALDASRRQASAAVVEKQGLVLGRPAAGFQVGADGLAGLAAHRHDALLAPLAHNPHQAVIEIEVDDVEGGQLPDPQAGGVEEFEHGPVPQGESVRGVAFVQQPEGLVHGQDLGEIVLFAGAGNDIGGIALQSALADQVAEKGPQGRQAPVDAGAARSFVQLGEVAAQEDMIHSPQEFDAASGAVGICAQKSEKLLEVEGIGANGVGRDVPLDPQIFEKIVAQLLQRRPPFQTRRIHNTLSQKNSPGQSKLLRLRRICKRAGARGADSPV